MNDATERWVEKVHPLARHAAGDDPFELLAHPTAGDPEVMLECLLQEFLWMGWGTAELIDLFRNPGYPLLCMLREHYGEESIRKQIDAFVARSGVPTFRETLAEPESDEIAERDEPALVQIAPLC
ncbi:MAG: hypothetical protein WD875_16240 [Pirellulales bacterium]